MRIPVIRGIIDRRILANYRVDPEVMAAVVPPPFRPQQVEGYAIGGICLIRLKQVRPKLLPLPIGISSENAAHRIAVEWDTDKGLQTGVYITRRDTSSVLNALAGGRLFPGVHHHARFEVLEELEHFHVAMTSDDGAARVLVDGRITREIPETSVFPNVRAVSEFFESGSLGYSPTATAGEFDGLELRTTDWSVTPLAIEQIESSFFDDRQLFPEGSIAFDNALLMQSIEHEWHGQESMACCPASVG